MRRVIAGIHGGLGNQLFCYANAYSIARRNNAELILDTKSSYHAENKYNAVCMLKHFNIKWEEASGLQRFIRTRARKHNGIKQLLTMKKGRHVFLTERKDKNKCTDYNDIVEKSYTGYTNIYVNGLWQCEKYFSEFSSEIFENLQILTPLLDKNLETIDALKSINSVAIHARNAPHLPHMPGNNYCPDEIRFESYYRNAVNQIISKVDSPVFYCFGDIHVWPDFIRNLPSVVIVDWNNPFANGAIQDFALMSHCRHFIVGPSTFSWWAAWLGENKDSVICAPSNNKYRFSGNKSVLPDRWISIN